MDKPSDLQRDSPPPAGTRASLVKPQPTCTAHPRLRCVPTETGGQENGTPEPRPAVNGDPVARE